MKVVMFHKVPLFFNNSNITENNIVNKHTLLDGPFAKI